MAKQNRKKNSYERKKMSSGISIDIYPPDEIYMNSVRASVKYPKVPQFCEETDVGYDECYDLTWDILNDETMEDEEKKELELELVKYEADRREADIELTTRMTRAILLNYVKVPLPKNGDWLENHRLIGLEIPKTEKAMKLFYLENEVIKTAEDLELVFDTAMGMMGVSEERLKEAQELFRGDKEEPTS